MSKGRTITKSKVVYTYAMPREEGSADVLPAWVVTAIDNAGDEADGHVSAGVYQRPVAVVIGRDMHGEWLELALMLRQDFDALRREAPDGDPPDTGRIQDFTLPELLEWDPESVASSAYRHERVAQRNLAQRGAAWLTHYAAMLSG